MKNKRLKRWTVIVIGDNRQLGSFDITESIIIIFLLAVFSLASVTFAAYLLHDKKQALVREEISRELENTQDLLTAANQNNSELAATITAFEERMTTTVKPAIKVVKKTPPPPPLPKKEEPIITVVEGVEEAGVVEAEVVAKPPPPEVSTVDISNFNIRRRSSDSISYSFRIKNADTDNAPVSGYTFAILRSDSTEQSSWISNPKTTLVNGMPQYFKTGEYFSINRYKTTRGRFEHISGKKGFNIITILVFSNSGKLILKRDHKI